MAEQVHQYTVSIPAGTAKNALFSANMAVPQGVVQYIDLEVPPGPSYLMGFYLLNSGQQMIPFEVGQFIVWDDVQQSWPLEKFITTGAWSLAGYNLDTFNAHAVTVRFHQNALGPTSTPTVQVNIVTTPPVLAPINL